MIEFILGTLFGFGSFVLTLYVINNAISNNADSYAKILSMQFKERFGADKKEENNKK